MEYSNIDLSPRASASLDQLTSMIDAQEMLFQDAVTVAQVLVRIDQDPHAAWDSWIPLPGEPTVENVLAERVEGTKHVFVVLWEVRADLPAYVHDIGWEPRFSTPLDN